MASATARSSEQIGKAERDKLLQRFPPFIASHLDFLVTRSPFPVKIDNVVTGSRTSNHADRFSLLVPCCLDFVKWDIIYNGHYPNCAPDIIFGCDDESFQPLNFEKEASRALVNIFSEWKPKESSMLLQLVTELRKLYLSHHRKRVEELDDPRLKFEISTIIAREGVEICLLPGADRPDEAKFSVLLLDLDLSKYLVGYSPGKTQQIYLQVVFPVRKRLAAMLSPSLKLVAIPTLKELLDIDAVKLPSWIDGMCMAEYIPYVEDNLKGQVSEAIASAAARRSFIEALVHCFGRPLEVETIFCRKASFLIVAGTFTFLVHFLLPLSFPKQQPILTFQSSQHFDSQGIPIISRPYIDYPWSPRWDTSEMVQRIFEFASEECISFKKYCSEALPLHR